MNKKATNTGRSGATTKPGPLQLNHRDHREQRRKEDPNQYWPLIIFYLIVLLFVVGSILAYLYY